MLHFYVSLEDHRKQLLDEVRRLLEDQQEVQSQLEIEKIRGQEDSIKFRGMIMELMEAQAESSDSSSEESSSEESSQGEEDLESPTSDERGAKAAFDVTESARAHSYILS